MRRQNTLGGIVRGRARRQDKGERLTIVDAGHVGVRQRTRSGVVVSEHGEVLVDEVRFWVEVRSEDVELGVKRRGKDSWRDVSEDGLCGAGDIKTW